MVAAARAPGRVLAANVASRRGNDASAARVATHDGTKARAAAFREHYLLFLDLLDFREEVPESGNTTSASAG